MARSCTSCITPLLHRIAQTRLIHAVSWAWCCMRILERMAHRRAGRNCTAVRKAIRAARQGTPLIPLSFWVITSMRSRQAHTALRSGTTHATPPTAPPRMRGACHYAEVTPRRALRHSKIVRLLSATSTFLAGRQHLERNRQRIGNESNAAMIFTRADFVNGHGDILLQAYEEED